MPYVESQVVRYGGFTIRTSSSYLEGVEICSRAHAGLGGVGDIVEFMLDCVADLCRHFLAAGGIGHTDETCLL